MCGVAAILGSGVGKDYTRIKQLGVLLEAMSSRGPDYEGKQFSDNVLLGHRLLRILPCSLSTQPMRMAPSSLSIVFNGEIYNYRELRDRLRCEGLSFSTDTDTEVVLAVYLRFGVDGFRLLKGMFAFIIHDEERQRVVTARDRFGQKPLYLFQHDGHVFLCSSFSAIRKLPQVRHQVNLDRIADYIWTLNTLGDETLLAGVSHHPVGCAITWEAGSNRVLANHRFAACAFDGEPAHRSLQDYVEEAHTRLTMAMSAVTNAVPSVACHLSGGIDSSLLSLMCARQAGTRLRLFTCRFDWDPRIVRSDEKHFNEHQYARIVAEYARAPQHEIHISAEHYRLSLHQVFQLLEEPKGNAAIAHAMLADVVSGYSRVCISGEGADELFGGYVWKLAASQAGSPSEMVSSFFAKLMPCRPEVMRTLVRLDDTESVVRQRVADLLDFKSGRPAVDSIMDFELQSFLRYLLIQADKIAGHYSIEGRYPFLHDDVADFAFRLPQHLRFTPDFQNGKPVLANLLQRWLPSDIVNRPKVGFVGPEGSWYATELWGLTSSLLRPQARIADYVCIDALGRVLTAHRAGTINARKLIWGLLFLEHFLAEIEPE